MAKRKRLNPAASPPPRDASAAGALETKSMFSRYPLGVAPKPGSRAPIAQVAGDAAAQSALEELADEVQAARAAGRMVLSVPLDAIVADYLTRDRIALDPNEMDSLKDSLRTRGQQTPIEVVDLGTGQYGLISGWRRLHAFRALHAEAEGAAFGKIHVLIKAIETASDSYVAMVEENEIRANLSFYERAHLACEAAHLGIYPSPARAVQVLFANATSARRSKIVSFVKLHEALGRALRFPAAIPEKLGLALVSAIDRDSVFAARLRDVLRKRAPQTAEAERSLLEAALKRAPDARAPAPEVAAGVRVEARKGRLVLTGPAVTEDLQKALVAWLAAR